MERDKDDYIAYAESHRGVSTVVGVTVLVGVVVLLAALVGSAVFGIADTDQNTAFAGVTVSQTTDTIVEVRVDSMGEAEALLVETAGGRQIISSPGVYEYDSFGQDIRIIGSNGETTQLLRTFEPDTEQAEVANILTVESDQTVQSTTENQTFETLRAAKQAAEEGDVIRFDSGVHVQPDTVNESITTPVTIVAEPNTVFSCDKTKVNLRLENATMSQRSAFIQTNQCGFQPVTAPAPKGSGGSVDVLAGGTDTSTSNQQTGTNSDTSLFVASSDPETIQSDPQPTATTDTSVTLRVSSTSNYKSLTVNTQAGSQTFTEPGIYSVETYGYNATVTGTTDGGETVQLDTIVSEEQQPTVTADTTQDGETVNKTETQPVDTYLVEADEASTVASDSSDSVKRVSTLSKADTQASKGDLIKLQSGVHSDPGTVATSLSTNTTLAIEKNVELSCEQTKIALSLGKATLSEQSPFPDVFCDEYDEINQSDVVSTLNSESTSSTIPSNLSLAAEDTYFVNEISVREIATGPNNNLYVVGKKDGGTSDQAHISSYAPNGTQRWSKGVDFNGYGTASFEDVEVTQNGSVYVAGAAPLDGSKAYDEFITLKYTSDGERTWQNSVKCEVRNCRPDALVIGNSGSVYTIGINDGTSGSLSIVQTSKDGQDSTVTDTSQSYKAIRTAKFRGSNSIYIAAKNQDGNPSVIKYDTTGEKAWNNTLEGGFVSGLFANSNSNIYATERVLNSNGETTSYIYEFKQDGTVVSKQKYGADRYLSLFGSSDELTANNNPILLSSTKDSSGNIQRNIRVYNSSGVVRELPGKGDFTVTDDGILYTLPYATDKIKIKIYK